jgi:hypothetical protein
MHHAFVSKVGSAVRRGARRLRDSARVDGDVRDDGAPLHAANQRARQEFRGRPARVEHRADHEVRRQMRPARSLGVTISAE